MPRRRFSSGGVSENETSGPKPRLHRERCFDECRIVAAATFLPIHHVVEMVIEEIDRLSTLSFAAPGGPRIGKSTVEEVA
jgi:hypothetical protein